MLFLIGSSVATSLSEGESKEKCVGLLQVWNKKFELQPIPLKTVRPFIFESIKLSQCTILVTESTSNSVCAFFLLVTSFRQNFSKLDVMISGSTLSRR